MSIASTRWPCGLTDYSHPHILTFDAFNPKQLTGSELAKRYNRDDVASSARQYAEAFRLHAEALMHMVDINYQIEGLPLTPKEAVTLFVTDHAQRIGMEPATIARCEEQLNAAITLAPAARSERLSALSRTVAEAFEARGEHIRQNLGAIATTLRHTFGTEENRQGLEEDHAEREQYIAATRATLATLPEHFTTIAAYNGLTLYPTPDTKEEGMLLPGAARVSGFTRVSENFIVASNNPAVILEELVHYCDIMLGPNTHKLKPGTFSPTSFSQSPKAVEAMREEAKTYQDIINLAASRYAEKKSQAEINRADSFTTGVLCKEDLDRYPPELQSCEHLANMCKLATELRSPHSQMHKLLDLGTKSGDDFLKKFLPKSTVMLAEFEQRCKHEATRLKSGGTPHFAPNEVPPSQQQVFVG